MKLNAPWLKNYGDVRHSLQYPDITMWEAVYQIACKYPEHTALTYMDRKITYREMIERIVCVQGVLERSGVQKGDRVAVCLPNIPQAVYALYALNRMGAVASFLHPLSAPEELVEFLGELGAECIITLESLCPVFRNVMKKTGDKTLILTSPADELSTLKRVAYRISQVDKNRKIKKESHFLRWRTAMHSSVRVEAQSAQISADAPAVILFSGGTTGVPKGVLLSSKGLNAMGMQTVEMSHCKVLGASMLAAMPMFHGFGLGVCIHTVLMHGGNSILVPRFTVEEYAKLIKKHRPNFIAGVPTLFEALTRSKSLRGADLGFLRGVFSGGDTLPIELKKKFDGYLKEHGATVKIREGYGATECVTASCLTPYHTEREGSIGLPFPDTFYKICRIDSTEEVPFGREGEICITGPALMMGYLNYDEETAKVLKGHSDGHRWLHTGDIGVMDEDGFVYFRQRIKRVIVTSGYNVYPTRIEHVLNTHPAVHQSCVIGVRDPYRMQRIKAFVVPSQGFAADEKLKLELIEHCRQSIARYAVPGEIEFRSSLPTTKVGKIAYKELEAEANS